MNPPVRPPLGAALALLLALAPLAGGAAGPVVAVIVTGLVLLIAAGWPELLELRSPRGTRVVVGGTGVLGAALALFSPGRIESLEGVAMICAVGVFAAFVHQMVRRDREGLTASLTGTVAGVMLVGMASCWIAAPVNAASPATASLASAAAAGLAGALLVLPLPLHAAVRAPLALALACGVTALVLVLLVPGSLVIGLAAGALVGIGACAAHLLLGSALVAREPLPSLTVAAAPVATTGIVVLLAESLLA